MCLSQWTTCYLVYLPKWDAPNQTSLSLLKTFQDFNRPSKYQPKQNPSLAMGVCIGLKEPVTVTVANLVNGDVIACLNTKQLLNKPIKQKPKKTVRPLKGSTSESIPLRLSATRGLSSVCSTGETPATQLSHRADERTGLTSPRRRFVEQPLRKGMRIKRGKKAKKNTRYELFLRRRQQQQDNDVKRQYAQTKFANNRFRESELGQYVDRLLAKAIVEMAIKYRVSSIVLPNLDNVREILDSEIQAKAEAKIPGCKQAQKQYARKYRQSIHRWSYARLCDAIASKATQKGIAIECERQLFNEIPEIQARDLALTAYRNRQKTTG